MSRARRSGERVAQRSDGRSPRRAKPRADAAPANATTAPPARIPAIDALRGIAIIAMIAYHFCFDLRHYGAIAADFEHDPFWLTARALIVTAFMTLVGVSLVLATEAGTPAAKFWQRIGLIAACAVAVSVASYVMFPASYIHFGILHAIAVASVLAAPLVRYPRAALVIGIAVVVAGNTFADPVFDRRALSWIGFVTTKPNTEDYVPLAPWSGLVLIGIALGHALVGTRFRALAPLARTPRWLGWCGRHSLAIYMVHQPILLGAMRVALFALRGT